MNEPLACLVHHAKYDNVYVDRTTHELERKTMVVCVFHVGVLRFILKVAARFGDGH